MSDISKFALIYSNFMDMFNDDSPYDADERVVIMNNIRWNIQDRIDISSSLPMYNNLSEDDLVQLIVDRLCVLINDKMTYATARVCMQAIKNHMGVIFDDLGNHGIEVFENAPYADINVVIVALLNKMHYNKFSIHDNLHDDEDTKNVWKIADEFTMMI